MMAGREATVGEVVREVEKDSVFYWNSGGAELINSYDIQVQIGG